MSKPILLHNQHAETVLKPYHYKECGLDNVWLFGGFTTEVVDGEEYVSIMDVDGLWKAIGLDLVANRKTFTPKEIRFLRLQMGKTQSELASLLRVDDQTVARWENKKCKIPGPADLALRFLFLACEVAQPEGGQILQRLHEVVTTIVETDAPVCDDIHFMLTNKRWEPQRMAMC